MGKTKLNIFLYKTMLAMQAIAFVLLLEATVQGALFLPLGAAIMLLNGAVAYKIFMLATGPAKAKKPAAAIAQSSKLPAASATDKKLVFSNFCENYADVC